MMKDMLTQKDHLPHVNALAERLVTDIHHRGLSVGDRYLTTAEVSRMLGVRKSVAGQAIRQLAERDILVPKQRSGTFVGPGLQKQKRSKVRTVHVLLPAGDPSATHWAFQPFIEGIRREMADINAQFTFVPENGPVEYVRELIDGSRASCQYAGVVAVSCPAEVYRYLADLRLPAVVSGSLYSEELALGSVDSDNMECGRLLTQYLIDRGHRRIALLMTGGGRPGDNSFLDGITDAMSQAGLAPNALIQRFVRNDLQALQAMAKGVLEKTDHPTAIITRGSYQAEAMASVASSLGLNVPDGVEVVFDHQDETTPRVDVTSYPRVEPTLSFIEIAATFGKILNAMSEGISSPPPRVVVPVQLHIPELAAK
jgi:DNA-binding LacI/PurR family transcriptional regulator